MREKIAFRLVCSKCGRNDLDIMLYTVDGKGHATKLDEPLVFCARTACGHVDVGDRKRVAKALRADNRLNVLYFGKDPRHLGEDEDFTEVSATNTPLTATIGDVTNVTVH